MKIFETIGTAFLGAVLVFWAAAIAIAPLALVKLALSYIMGW